MKRLTLTLDKSDAKMFDAVVTALTPPNQPLNASRVLRQLIADAHQAVLKAQAHWDEVQTAKEAQ